MTEPLTIFIPGIPQPQGSAKAFVVKGRAIITSANSKVKTWRQDIASMIGEREPFLGAVIVDLRFWFPRPTNHYNSKGRIKDAFVDAPKLTRPDLDKCVRAILDALTIAGVYRDDSQVTDLYAYKMFTDNEGLRSSSVPGVLINAEERLNV